VQTADSAPARQDEDRSGRVPGHGHGHAHDPHAAAGAHEPLGHRFESAEQWASHFDDPDRDAWQKPEEVARVMGLRPGQVVADIGAGTGYFLKHLSNAVGATGRVIAVDIEPDMVRYLTNRADQENLRNVEVRRGTPNDSALEPKSADRILLVNTWHHIPARVEYARALLGALRPGGGVYVVDYTMQTPHGPPRNHRLPADTVAQELRAAGFLVSVAEESLPRQYIIVGRPP